MPRMEQAPLQLTTVPVSPASVTGPDYSTDLLPPPRWAIALPCWRALTGPLSPPGFGLLCVYSGSQALSLPLPPRPWLTHLTPAPGTVPSCQYSPHGWPSSPLSSGKLSFSLQHLVRIPQLAPPPPANCRHTALLPLALQPSQPRLAPMLLIFHLLPINQWSHMGGSQCIDLQMYFLEITHL